MESASSAETTVINYVLTKIGSQEILIFKKYIFQIFVLI